MRQKHNVPLTCKLPILQKPNVSRLSEPKIHNEPKSTRHEATFLDELLAGVQYPNTTTVHRSHEVIRLVDQTDRPDLDRRMLRFLPTHK